MSEQYFTELNGYLVKDKEARESISTLETDLAHNKLKEVITDNNSLNKKFKNINVSVEYYKNTPLYKIRLKNIDEIKVIATGGDVTSPSTNAKNLKDFTSSNTSFDLVLNGGAFNINTNEPIGYCIFDESLYTPSDLGSSYIYYGGFDENNNLLIKKGSEVSSINDLVNLGFKNCIGGFTALYDNGTPITQTEEGNIEIVHVIAQLNNGEYLILASTGRLENMVGVTYQDMIDYLSNYDIKTAFCLDGGGSTQEYYNGKSILNPQDTNPDRIDGRAVPTAVGIKLNEVI